ncbi:MAG: FAD-binding protein [Acetobacteraceae bacterium]|nr:FAD-binding protein [Acetobacteraceae bacterium]
MGRFPRLSRRQPTPHSFDSHPGWALHNTASLPHVTLGGATATGTHGSGDQLGTLSSAVAGLELVTATGDLISAQRGDLDFDGMVVNLGALGVVTRVALDIQPTFDMRQDAFEGLAWDTLTGDFDAVMSAGYSVSLLTKWATPTVTRLWVKSRLDDASTVPMARLDVSLAASPSADLKPDGIAALNEWGKPGPWSERLPHFRPGVDPGTVGHLQSEYMLPRSRAIEAIRLLRVMGPRIDPFLLTTEIRSMAQDSLWLSPAHGRDTIGIHFSWARDLEAVPRISAEVEPMLSPLGARPHWGKIIHARARELAPLYPRLEDFRALARRFDPGGKFRNAFLDAHVFGEAPD